MRGRAIWKFVTVPLVAPAKFNCWGCVGVTGAFMFFHPRTESYVIGSFKDTELTMQLDEVENIFLDAGGVLLDESEYEQASARIISDIVNARRGSYSTRHYWIDVEEAVRSFVPNVYDYVLWKNSEDEHQYFQCKREYRERLRSDRPPIALTAGISDLLPALAGEYRLGILGQYGDELLRELSANSLLEYFTFRATQESYRLTKPDPRYFEQILSSAHVEPARSVMVGDRIDKDVIPAKMIGMKTIRLKSGIYRGQVWRTPEEKPDLEIDSLQEMGVLLSR